MANRNWSVSALHSFGDLFSALLSQIAGVSDTKAVLEDFLDFFQSKAGNFWVEEVDHDPADGTDASVEAEGTGRSESL